jgi:hypothetical protein
MKPEYKTPFPAALCYAFGVVSFLGGAAWLLIMMKGDAEPSALAAGCCLSSLLWLAIGQVVERPFKKDHEERIEKWKPTETKGGFLHQRR